MPRFGSRRKKSPSEQIAKTAAAVGTTVASTATDLASTIGTEITKAQKTRRSGGRRKALIITGIVGTPLAIIALFSRRKQQEAIPPTHTAESPAPSASPHAAAPVPA